METLLQKCMVGIGILAVLLMISGCVGWGLCEGTGKCLGDATCEGTGECHVYGKCEGFSTCDGTGTCKGTGTCEGIETDAGNGTIKCEGRGTCQGFGTCEGIGICSGSGKCKAGGTATCEGTGYCEGLGSCWPFSAKKDTTSKTQAQKAPVTDWTKRYYGNENFSAFPPQGRGWHITHNESVVSFTKVPAGKVDPHHTFVATVQVIPAPDKKAKSAEDFQRIIEDLLVRTLTEGRFRLVSEKVTPFGSEGDFCAQYDIVQEERDNPIAPGMILEITAHGFMCLGGVGDHIVHAFYSERKEQGSQSYFDIKDEGDEFLGNVEFARFLDVPSKSEGPETGRESGQRTEQVPGYVQGSAEEKKSDYPGGPALRITLPANRPYFVQPVNVFLENTDNSDGLIGLTINVTTNPAGYQHVLTARFAPTAEVTQVGTRVRLAGRDRAVVEVVAETHAGKVISATEEVWLYRGVDFSDKTNITQRLSENVAGLQGPVGTARSRIKEKTRNTRKLSAIIYHPMLPQIGEQAANKLSDLKIQYRDKFFGQIEYGDAASNDPYIDIHFTDDGPGVGPVHFQWTDINRNIFELKED